MRIVTASLLIEVNPILLHCRSRDWLALTARLLRGHFVTAGHTIAFINIASVAAFRAVKVHDEDSTIHSIRCITIIEIPFPHDPLFVHH